MKQKFERIEVKYYINIYMFYVYNTLIIVPRYTQFILAILRPNCSETFLYICVLCIRASNFPDVFHSRDSGNFVRKNVRKHSFVSSNLFGSKGFIKIKSPLLFIRLFSKNFRGLSVWKVLWFSVVRKLCGILNSLAMFWTWSMVSRK